MELVKKHGRPTTKDVAAMFGLHRHTAEKYIRAAVEQGQLIRHGRSGVFRDKRDQLAAENAALKAAFNPEEIPEDAVEAFTETAIMDHDWDDTCSWPWVENDTDVIRAVLAVMAAPATPATDAFLAKVRASTLEDLAKTKRIAITHPGFANKFVYCPLCGSKVEGDMLR
ncbi:DUF977 family protein [Leclercia adecarboxylata]|uniref:DUF977 family protein n=1 Tax=Leclercia adecarboxylata TaxID=83655 RepID=UPI003AF11BC4